MLVAEGSDESVGKIATERSLETFKGGRFGRLSLPGDRADIGEKPLRSGRRNGRKYGGTHATTIGRRSHGADPWRE